MLCNKYNTCSLTTVLMYYTIFIVVVPYSLDLFISSSSLLCKTCMLLFAILAVTFYPTSLSRRSRIFLRRGPLSCEVPSRRDSVGGGVVAELFAFPIAKK